MTSSSSSLDRTTRTRLLAALACLHRTMCDSVRQNQSLLANVHPKQALGAVNLLQYLAFRACDVRQLQDELHVLGLSSLASAESHICAQIEQTMHRLGWRGKDSGICTCQRGKASLDAHTRRLFGAKQKGAVTHIMVTLDERCGGDVELLVSALQRGMRIARINCAHADRGTWLRWIANLHSAVEQSRLPCKLYMDLPGPKMRMQLVGGLGKKGRIKIRPGDEILLVEDGSTASPDIKTIACQEAGIVAQLSDGNQVLIDDGKYAGEVVHRDGECFLRITRVTGNQPRLVNDKGINFPGVELQLPIITHTDAGLLPFIAEHADMMGCSFVRSRQDVATLRAALASYPRCPDLILKIETPEAVLHLPELLLEAMQDRSCGVMIARGDLAVELGFTHLNDVQDKILWLCEAAHVPVIWATQVLESLQKTGLATRSEITDAAHAFKAECVMLNKGDYLLETLETLQDILHRTDAHRMKKRYNLRPLTVAVEFFQRHQPDAGTG